MQNVNLIYCLQSVTLIQEKLQSQMIYHDNLISFVYITIKQKQKLRLWFFNELAVSFFMEALWRQILFTLPKDKPLMIGFLTQAFGKGSLCAFREKQTGFTVSTCCGSLTHKGFKHSFPT